MKSRSYIAIPPGETILEQLDHLRMSREEFAGRMGMTGEQVRALLSGEAELTPETAENLELVLGPPAAFWSRLEALYREKLSRVREENARDSCSRELCL